MGGKAGRGRGQCEKEEAGTAWCTQGNWAGIIWTLFVSSAHKVAGVPRHWSGERAPGACTSTLANHHPLLIFRGPAAPATKAQRPKLPPEEDPQGPPCLPCPPLRFLVRRRSSRLHDRPPIGSQTCPSRPTTPFHHTPLPQVARGLERTVHDLADGARILAD